MGVPVCFTWRMRTSQRATDADDDDYDTGPPSAAAATTSAIRVRISTGSSPLHCNVRTPLFLFFVFFPPFSFLVFCPLTLETYAQIQNIHLHQQ